MGNPGNRCTLLWFQSGRYLPMPISKPDVSAGVFFSGTVACGHYVPFRRTGVFVHSREVME